jgi:hypothetical protein
LYRQKDEVKQQLGDDFYAGEADGDEAEAQPRQRK